MSVNLTGGNVWTREGVAAEIREIAILEIAITVCFVLFALVPDTRNVVV